MENIQKIHYGILVIRRNKIMVRKKDVMKITKTDKETKDEYDLEN